MTLPRADTRVSYPEGALTERGTVLHVEQLAEGRAAVVLDRTAIHPVDTAWPDQPADRGVLRWDGGEARILDAVTGGIHEGTLHLGEALPVRTGTEGWTFVVAHVVEAAPPLGATVEVDADAQHRHALSAGHTACHVAALALDAALAEAWSKRVRPNALGLPGFDGAAIQSSRIEPFGSVDVYRVGKSLRKAGFDPAALEHPDDVAERANELLAAWVSMECAVRIERDDDALSARRTWVCSLPEGEARIPCGGTHLTNLSELAAITVSLQTTEVSGGLELTMRTVAVAAK
jgi:alanyl-tRNA synthetase